MKINKLAGAFVATSLVAACMALPVLADEKPSVWTPDLDCSMCHVDEHASFLPQDEADASEAATEESSEPAEASEAAAQTEADEEAARIAEVEAWAFTHVNSYGLECVDCHADEEKMVSAHKRMATAKKMPDRLKKTKVNTELCLTCHDMEQVAEKTAQSTAIVDEDGVSPNPHALPDGHDAITCFDCHSAHSGEGFGNVFKDTCKGCHHALVFECGTCHDAAMATT